MRHHHLSHPAYRPDIDGLRAVAVLGVLICHVSPQLLSGGFLGVDVFFVISGYLISLIIFRELSEGGFSLRRFYARRIRRLFPALIVVLLASLMFGGYALFAEEYQRLGKHAVMAIGFLLNFQLMREAGYFDVVSDSKPLLHLWSLSVEEQFYLVWPSLLLAIRYLRISITALVVVALASSFIFALYFAGKSLDALYFHPLARFWELLFGAALAYLHHRVGVDALPVGSRMWIRHGLSLAGLGLIFWGMFFLNGKVPHPGVSALVPVLGAVAVIASGSLALGNRILAWRPLVWVGLISYPLYLWHWPVLSYLRIVEAGSPSTSLLWVAAGVSVLLAWATYVFVERPVRHGFSGVLMVRVLSLSMVVLMASSALLWRGGGLPDRDSVRYAQGFSHQMIREPASDQTCRAMFPESDSPVYCRLRSHGNGIVAVFGDSHAHALYPGIADVAAQRGYGSLLLANSGCPPLLGSTWGRNDSEKRACAESIEKIVSALEKNHRIDALVLATRGPQYITGTGFGPAEAHYDYPPLASSEKDVSQVLGRHPADIFETGLENTIDRLSRQGIPIVYVLQVPELGVSPNTCIERPLTLSGRHPGCVVTQATYLERMKTYRLGVARVAKNKKSFAVADPMSVFCDGTECRGLWEGRLMYADDNHLSLMGAARLAPLVFERLHEVGFRENTQ
jgi:peptidoglycan/LPS O-acetylase OafA/YrhL